MTTFDVLRFRQTSFREGDKLVFKRSGTLPLLFFLFDNYAYKGDYLLRSAIGWEMYQGDGSKKIGHLLSDLQVKQMLGSRCFNDLESKLQLTDSQAEELLRKFESEEKTW